VSGKKRILFVDDDPLILAGIRSVFYRERHRWELVFATGGEEALAELERGAFDVVVSDLRMPGIDGLALLARVRETSPATARVMLSGSADRDEIGTSPAVEELLRKPCDARTMRSTLERMLERRVV
jgi:CheY-like chemotaxis protein